MNQGTTTSKREDIFATGLSKPNLRLTGPCGLVLGMYIGGTKHTWKGVRSGSLEARSEAEREEMLTGDGAAKYKNSGWT